MAIKKNKKTTTTTKPRMVASKAVAAVPVASIAVASTTSTTTPSSSQSPTINISSYNVYGNCDLKCSYNFKYNNTNLVAKNNGVFISYSHDTEKVNPVIYNNQNYNVSKINIYSPSLHKFNDTFVNAEIIIEHTPQLGGELLYVCIPTRSSSESSDASYIISEIIQGVANNAPALNESTNLNLSNFNLNTIVPKKPFYSYSGIEGLVGQVIVFGNNNAIPISQNILNVLSKIIKPYPITIRGGEVFFNPKGPNMKQNDGIYISCQPTGSSEEEKDITYKKVNYDLFSDPKTNLVLQIILGFILCVIIFMMLNFAYNYFINKSPEISVKNIFRR